MSPGAKVFLTLGAVAGVFGVIAIASSRKASASPGGTVVVPPTDDDEPTVTPSEPEGGFVRDSPFSVPGIQDAQEASRILLRWWSAEGQSLVGADTSSSKPSVPFDFGSQSSDLSGQFTPRVQAAARAFQHYNGLTPEDGQLSNPLLLALRRWATSQALPSEALPPAQSPSSPTLPPIVLPAPSLPTPPQSGPPPFVPLPPIVSQTPPAVIPVPPVIPDQGAPVPPVVLPPAALPPQVPTVPLPPIVAPPSAPVALPPTTPPATTVQADTAAMVNALLQAEGSKGWNKAEPTVQAWQKPRGLKVDGLFGPKTALAVAEQFGTVPIIRVWPAGSMKAKALQDYRAALVELANESTDPVRAKQLRVSAQREQGQGHGPKRGTAAPLPESLQVQLAKVA